MADEPLPVMIHRLPGAEDLPLPAYQSEHASGMDLHAAVPAPVHIAPGSVELIPCGFAVAIPPDFEAQIRPRSGLAVTQQVLIPNSPATIDADYRGEVKVPLMNLGVEPFRVTRGMRIAQMVFARTWHTAWLAVDVLPPTERGEGGFGHTGL